LVEKNTKFVQYLQTELNIIRRLKDVPGVIPFYGMMDIDNPFTNNKE
jgi:hypothetical protein